MSSATGLPEDELVQRSEAAVQKLRLLLNQREPVPLDALSSAIHVESPRGELQEAVLHELANAAGPSEWAVCFLGDKANNGTAEPEPFAGQRVSPHIVESIIRQVPALAEAIKRREVFELIGPAGVIEKLRSGALELVPSKGGTVLGSLRIPQKNKIVQQARFRKIELAAGMGLQLAFSALTIAVGASYMQRIDRQLAALNEKMDRVLDTLRVSRHARLVSAIELLAELNRQYVAAGHFTPSMRQRLHDAEKDLNGSYQELKLMHASHRDRLRGMADGPLAKYEETYDSYRSEILADARALVAAQTGLIEVDRLALLCEMEHEPELVAYREEKLRDASIRVNQLSDLLQYLKDFNDNCSKEIQRVQRQPVRYILQGSTPQKVSVQLLQDRLATLEILAELHQVASQQLQPERPTIIRIDARGDGIAAFALPAHVDEKS